MQKYVIVTDSSCDLPQDLADKLGLEVIPLTFNVKGKTYQNFLDGREYSFENFYEDMRAGEIITTAQVTPQKFIDIYKEYLDKGQDVLGIIFSSGLSGTFNSACIAAKMLQEDYPDRKIKIIDSKCASLGEGLFNYYASSYRASGMSIDECHDALLELLPKVNHWFTISDFETLVRGGRVTKTAAFFAKNLKIKPVLNTDDEGHLIPRFKKVGRKAAIKELVNQMDKLAIREPQPVFICHGDCIEDAKYAEKVIRKKFPFVTDVVINYTGPVIAAHSGVGTLSIFFIGSKRQV